MNLQDVDQAKHNHPQGEIATRPSTHDPPQRPRIHDHTRTDDAKDNTLHNLKIRKGKL